MADNVKQKEELDKVKAEAVDKKVLQDLGKKYFEATKQIANLQAEVDKISVLLKDMEERTWDEADKEITKAYEDQLPGLQQYGCQFGFKAALVETKVPADSPVYDKVPVCPRPVAPPGT